MGTDRGDKRVGGRGRKAETKMENGSRGKGKEKGERGGGGRWEKVDTKKRRQKTERKAESE